MNFNAFWSTSQIFKIRRTQDLSDILKHEIGKSWVCIMNSVFFENTWSDQQSMQPSSWFYCAPKQLNAQIPLQISQNFSFSACRFATTTAATSRSLRRVLMISRKLGKLWVDCGFCNQSFQTETPLKMLLEGRCKFYHVGVTSWWLVACSLLVASFLFVSSSKKPMDFRGPDFVTQTLFLHGLMLHPLVSWGDTAET